MKLLTDFNSHGKKLAYALFKCLISNFISVWCLVSLKGELSKFFPLKSQIDYSPNCLWDFGDLRFLKFKMSRRGTSQLFPCKHPMFACCCCLCYCGTRGVWPCCCCEGGLERTGAHTDLSLTTVTPSLAQHQLQHFPSY